MSFMRLFDRDHAIEGSFISGRLFRCDSEDSLDESSQKFSSDYEMESPVYKNDQHKDKAFEVMMDMRKNNKLCDVTLVAGSVEVNAHKMILAASSPYFYAMFNCFEERSLQRIHMKDFDPHALKLLIDYIYSSEVLVTEENVQVLLPGANLLQLTDVRDACCDFLESQLHPTNCLGIRAFADLHGCTTLFMRSEHYIDTHFEEVVECEEFLALPFSQVVKLISRDNLSIPTEEIVFKSVKTWIFHDLPERRELLALLMSHVRYPLLTDTFLTRHVSNDPMVRSCIHCTTSLIEALAYRLLIAKGETEIPFVPRNINPRTPPTVPKIMLVIGGQAPKAVKSVECYDFKEERWYKLGEMPSRRCRAGTSVLGGQIYTVGGFTGSLRVRTVDKYDAVNNKWDAVTGMVARRSTVGVAVLNGCLYAVGGFDGTNGLESVEVFNPLTEEWTMSSPMPTRRSSVGVGVLNGLLYVVGGYDGITRECLSSLLSFNPETQTWTRLNDMSTRRSGPGIGVVDGILYAAGGHDGPNVRKSVEAFDPETNSWSPAADMAMCRRNAGVVTLNSMLYVVGGDNGSTNLTSVEYYNPKTRIWTMLPKKMRIGRSYAGVAVIDKPR